MSENRRASKAQLPHGQVWLAAAAALAEARAPASASASEPKEILHMSGYGFCSTILIAATLSLAVPLAAQTVDNEDFRLNASDGAAGDQFGRDVAISGNVAIIGALGDDDAGSASGSAYVFRFHAASGSEETKLVASDGAPFDNAGFSVATCGTAVVGAHLNDDSGSASGSAYIFAMDTESVTSEAPQYEMVILSSQEGTHPNAINDDRMIVGSERHWAQTQAGDRWFSWIDGTLTWHTGPGDSGLGHLATDINNQGIVCGGSGAPGAIWSAWTWDSAAEAYSMLEGAPGVPDGNSQSVVATGINDAGWVVGGMDTCTGNPATPIWRYCGVAWSPEMQEWRQTLECFSSSAEYRIAPIDITNSGLILRDGPGFLGVHNFFSNDFPTFCMQFGGCGSAINNDSTIAGQAIFGGSQSAALLTVTPYAPSDPPTWEASYLPRTFTGKGIYINADINYWTNGRTRAILPM